MVITRGTQLQTAASLYIRASGVLDPVRLQVWEGMGLTFPQLRILFNIRNEPGVDVRTLSAMLGISPSAVSQQVDKLVGRELIRRSDNPEDRRRVCLELSEEGTRATVEISRTAHERVETLLTRLTDDELTVLQRLLSILLDGRQ